MRVRLYCAEIVGKPGWYAVFHDGGPQMTDSKADATQEPLHVWHERMGRTSALFEQLSGIRPPNMDSMLRLVAVEEDP